MQKLSQMFRQKLGAELKDKVAQAEANRWDAAEFNTFLLNS